MTIDLSASYLRVVTDALPDAIVVADRFHLVRPANDMVTDVRGRRGRKRDPEWAGRRRLLTAHERLAPASFAKLWNSLVDAGDPGIEILHAHTVKENLRSLLEPSGTDPDRKVIRERLRAFYDQAAKPDPPQVHRFTAIIQAWWPAVQAPIITRHSNARSEGCNRLAKHQDRNAFGFRNLDNHRRHVRWARTRQHRRASAATSEMPDQLR